ncbi:MAG: hypothetical protein IIY21_29325 [Clostridiales bacterium]|nr:hypothetical protein [Clostridiales bacterium]MBQ1298177.1 hypothetical protein [Clostridiales bacterium]MBQ1573573.1 hypothetical protein [Clostridiales bacterium]
MNDFFPFVYSDSDPEPILRDVFSGWESGTGLFSFLAAQTTMPWANAENVDNSVLDIAYFGNHSGGKFCAPLVKLLIDDEGVIPNAARVTIAKILISKYLSNWNHLWETNVVVYSPIHNYDMHEERDLATTDDNVETTDGELSRTGTEGLTHGMVESTQHGRTEDNVNYKYGLNTTVYQQNRSDENVSTEGGTTTTTDSGTDTTTRNLVDSTDQTVTEDNEGTEHEETHRYGNIGVTTTQKLLQEERNLWLWNFFDEVFNDLDKELALAFHDPCRV